MAELELDVDPNGDDEMAELGGIMNQNMAQLAQSGVVAQNNFITTSKALDLDYLEGKRMVTLEEALGAREVASARAQQGGAGG